jgi:AbrB family looped-hinge helix DNA binding protein
MGSTGRVKVSERGQMSLPAAARRRWGIEAGGELGWLDVGSALVLLPGGVDAARAALLAQVGDDDWAVAARGFGDPELADQ